MPQATPELRAKFPGDDSEALEVLEKNFDLNAGLFTLKDELYQPTQREWDAIDYLFQEWDYCFERKPIPVTLIIHKNHRTKVIHSKTGFELPKGEYVVKVGYIIIEK